MSRILSSATVTVVGLTCKAALNTGFCSVTIAGLPILRAALESPARSRGQGVVTVSNHISTLDDPVTWGILPVHYYLRSRTTRWALGASDIMFTNPVFSTFFRLGQTLETFRGKGVHQPAVDTAIAQLNQGGWVHLYGEGKVNQPDKYPQGANGLPRLPRFKWGVGRMIMETDIPPVVIPMWLTGFDQLMPEGRVFPYKYLPRPGTSASVTFGNAIPKEDIQQALETISPTCSGADAQLVEEDERPRGWLGDEVQRKMKQPNTTGGGATGTAEELMKTRARVTDIIHDAVEALGRSASGGMLSAPRRNQ